MKYQILFSGKKKEKNITKFSSADLAKRVVKVNIHKDLSNLDMPVRKYCIPHEAGFHLPVQIIPGYIINVNTWIV